MTSRTKKLMYALAFAVLGAALVAAKTPAKCSLTVKVTGLHNTDGNVKLTLRSDPDTVVERRVAEIDSKTMTATAVFENLAPGTYGVAVLHDQNNNGKLDFDDVGTPLEGYGHSNNPTKREGPPRFDETKLSLTEPAASIEIRLIYWP
jgi:uncharacterized protein (DUF2141 family)